MTVSARPTRHRGTPSDAEIRRVAAELFYRNGYRATSMQNLADTLGIAKPTLYSHAGSKERLLAAIFDDMIAASDRATEHIDVDGDPTSALRQVVASWTRLAVANAPQIRIFHGDHREFPAAIQESYTDWSRRVLSELRDLIRAGQRAGRFTAEADPTTVAFAVFSSVQWTPRWLSREGPLDVEDVAEQYCMLFLHGLVQP